MYFVFISISLVNISAYKSVMNLYRRLVSDMNRFRYR